MESKETYVPPDLLRNDDDYYSGFIHQVTDNIDINIETRDGKDTFHALASFVFQNQTVGKKMDVDHKREKSLQITDDVANLIKLEHHKLQEQRPVPPRVHDPISMLNNLKISNQATNGTKDLTWILLRLINRSILPLKE